MSMPAQPAVTGAIASPWQAICHLSPVRAASTENSALGAGLDDEALRPPTLPWRLMVLALTSSLVPPEPALKSSVRVHMAPKENAA